MTATAPFAVVLRLTGFQLSQAELELRLKAAVDRYSLDKGGYAQISMEENVLDWKAIDGFLQLHGPATKELRGGGDVQSASLDLAYDVREGVVVASRTIPAQSAALAGTHGIDIMFSAYLTAPD